MFEFLINSATVVLLGGCVYAAWLMVFQARNFRPGTACKRATLRENFRADPDFRNPSLGYYI